MILYSNKIQIRSYNYAIYPLVVRNSKIYSTKNIAKYFSFEKLRKQQGRVIMVTNLGGNAMIFCINVIHMKSGIKVKWEKGCELL